MVAPIWWPEMVCIFHFHTQPPTNCLQYDYVDLPETAVERSHLSRFRRFLAFWTFHAIPFSNVTSSPSPLILMSSPWKNGKNRHRIAMESPQKSGCRPCPRCSADVWDMRRKSPGSSRLGWEKKVEVVTVATAGKKWNIGKIQWKSPTRHVVHVMN